MNTDTHAVLVDQIVDVMALLQKDQARELAMELVTLVNMSLAGETFTRCSETAANLLPPPLRTPGALTAPWQAFQLVHDRDSSATTQGNTTELLCTFPFSFRQKEIAHRLAQQRRIRAGTLMTRLYEIINGTTDSLYLVCPYWSEMGMLGLMRHLNRDRMNGVQVVVLTRPREALDTDNLRGVHVLQEEMVRRGASVVIKSPPQGRDGKTPLVHAKVVVRDGVEAYLGSANLSLSGMESSFEVGVLLTGYQAHGLQDWAQALEGEFESWK